MPSQKTSSDGSTESTAPPSLSAPSLQSVSGHPVPQEALPWGSLLRSTAKTFQKSPERPPFGSFALRLYLSQSFFRAQTTLSSGHPPSSSYHSSVIPLAAAWWISSRTKMPLLAASRTK